MKGSKLQIDVGSIISSTFEKDFFYDKGSERTIYQINNHINQFNQRYPDLVCNLLSALKVHFPSATIEDHTQFFNNDRCIRFLLQLNSIERYVLQISIFEAFSIYKRSFKIESGRYYYDEIKFINNGESPICDKAFECLPIECQNFTWLERQTLEKNIPQFSVVQKEPSLSHIIKVADVLFTTHYI